MATPDDQSTKIVLEDPQKIIQTELEDTDRSIKEISFLLEQSRIDFNKLTQRNTVVMSEIQQLKSRINSIPSDEVSAAYEGILDIQQRMFIMRNQMEKLQEDMTHFEHNKKILEQLANAIGVGGTRKDRAERPTSSSMEMLVNIQEAERQRLSREMHDGPAQALSNFILQTEIALRLFDVDTNQARSELGNLKVAATKAFQKIRNFIFELRPMMLDDLGLPPTITRYVDLFKEQAGIDINVAITGTERRLEPFIEVMLFRSMQELLSNAVHQNQANQVKIQLDMDEKIVKLSMDDNGKGFDTDALGKEANLGLKLINGWNH
jgi:two-component system sensor histidine kinase DegS